jgi:hypothetical protein
MAICVVTDVPDTRLLTEFKWLRLLDGFDVFTLAPLTLDWIGLEGILVDGFESVLKAKDSAAAVWFFFKTGLFELVIWDCELWAWFKEVRLKLSGFEKRLAGSVVAEA